MNIYVDAVGKEENKLRGNDSNFGTYNKPLRTLKEAFKRVIINQGNKEESVMKKLMLIGILVIAISFVITGETTAKDISVDSALSAGLIKVGNLKMDKEINNGELEITLNSGLGIGFKGTIYYISKQEPNLLDFDIGIYSYIEGVNSDRVDLSVSVNAGFLQKGGICLANIGCGIRLSGSGDLNSRLFLLFSIGGFELMPDKFEPIEKVIVDI